MKKYIVYCHTSSCCTGKRITVGGFHFQHFKGGDNYEPKH